MTDVRAAVALAVLGLGGCDKLQAFASAEESAVQACEQRLKSSLTSPSSYRRTWSNFTQADPITKAEMIEKLEADRVLAVRVGNDAEAFSSAYILQCFQKNKCDGLPRFEQSPHPPTAFVLIEYEAANAFNAMLPGFFTCRMNLADDGKYTDTYIFTSSPVPERIGKQLKASAELAN